MLVIEALYVKLTAFTCCHIVMTFLLYCFKPQVSANFTPELHRIFHFAISVAVFPEIFTFKSELWGQGACLVHKSAHFPNYTNLDIDHNAEMCYLCEWRWLFQCIGYDCTFYMNLDVWKKQLNLNHLLTHCPAIKNYIPQLSPCG